MDLVIKKMAEKPLAAMTPEKKETWIYSMVRLGTQDLVTLKKSPDKEISCWPGPSPESPEWVGQNPEGGDLGSGWLKVVPKMISEKLQADRREKIPLASTTDVRVYAHKSGCYCETQHGGNEEACIKL